MRWIRLLLQFISEAAKGLEKVWNSDDPDDPPCGVGPPF
jgi:hypothetical protein